MAVANVKKGSNLCVSTHVGRKEDEEGTLVMTIEDIKRKMSSAEPGEGIESGMLECGEMEFKLMIYPNGMNQDRVGHISCRIFIKNRGKRQWRRVESLVAQNSSGAFLKTYTDVLENLLKEDVGYKKGFVKNLAHDLVLAEENSTFFPNGTLIVKVNIKVEGEETVTIKTTTLPDESITTSQLKGELSMHLGKMLESPRFSDVQIICQGETIPCHKDILSARSEYFVAMFEHDMKENKTGKVEIVDFDLETVKAVLHHIYTGDVNFKYSEENAEKMIMAADKYQLGGLKKKLEDILIRAVKVENAIDMFVLGDAVHAGKLRDLSKEVIVKNAVAIVEADDGWKEKLGRFKDLTLEIFEYVVRSKAQTK